MRQKNFNIPDTIHLLGVVGVVNDVGSDIRGLTLEAKTKMLKGMSDHGLEVLLHF